MTIPTATYRLQFRNGMTFDSVIAIVPYLKKLGISHLYASPIFTATTGSTHGYDVTNANEIDPDIGGRDGFDRLVDVLKREGLGLILDIVPNHMAASLENPRWRDVVEHGAKSRFAKHFDIDWTRPLTLPVLGQDFDDAVDAGEISVNVDPVSGKPTLSYFESHFPLEPSSYAGREKELVSTSDKRVITNLHDQQAYRLTCWRNARRDLSYRRFFEVTGLAGVRVEDPRVFDDTHQLILELVRSGSVDGLRIDHVDGLSDPKAYLERLRQEVGPECYITVEKILGDDEVISSDWPISGTTGYEFIAALSNIFTDNEKLPDLSAAYEETEGRMIDMAEELRDAKLLMADHNFAGEFSRLLSIAKEILKTEPDTPDENDIRLALRELVVSFPIYRTYGTSGGLPPDSEAMLATVIQAINGGGHPIKRAALESLQRILRGDVLPDQKERADEFRVRFQQLTGPLMAKSVEDTLFYRHNAALALNEVGAEPLLRRFSLERFHDEMAKRLQRQPDALSTTSTHDTKRGEDARARLYAITEAPQLWQQAFKRWQKMNASFRQKLDDGPAPEASVEWMLYQALMGVWPGDLDAKYEDGLAALEERFVAYTEKALREAKLRTNWGDSNEKYEKAVLDYARRLLSANNITFLTDFQDTIRPFIRAGLLNSLSQTLIKLTAPGVPDIYQGCEGMDLSLVDPDNRRMPEFAMFEKQLNNLKSSKLPPNDVRDPTFKQYVIAKALELRAAVPELFRTGEYLPLQTTGDGAQHVVSFARRGLDHAVIVIAPRLAMALLENGGFIHGNANIVLPADLANRRYINVLTGLEYDPQKTLDVADIAGDRNLALLRTV